MTEQTALDAPASDAVVTRQVIVAGHELTLYAESPPLIRDMLADIRAARTRVWLECYIYYPDAAGRAVAEALTERAAAGVDVRVLYDALGSQATPSTFFDALVRDGGRVHAYHTFWHALARRSILGVLNRRDHRKLLVVDDRVAYFGGMNIVEPTTRGGVGATAGLSRSGPRDSLGWRDLHVRLVGSQQADVAHSFERSWRRAHGQSIARRPRHYRRGQLAQTAESIHFFDSGPGLKHSRAARVFIRLMGKAEQHIMISMAYFLPAGRVLWAMLRARRRGVRISVIVPEVSDVRIVDWASRYMYGKLLRRGFRIYERQLRMLHSKALVADGEWTVVGSCNLDPRSMWHNLEFLAVIRSRPFAAAVLEICASELRASRRLTLEDMSRRTRWQRLLSRAAYMLRWWL